MRAVLDANVVAAGVIWNGEGYLVLVKMARRHFVAWATLETLEETRRACQRLWTQRAASAKAVTRLNWYCDKVKITVATPLGKQRSRDIKDDPYLGAALGAQANCIVTYDRDLLDMGKPFGVEIMRPMAFLKRLEEERQLKHPPHDRPHSRRVIA